MLDAFPAWRVRAARASWAGRRGSHARSRGSARTVATNRRFMPVPPQAVWDALADPAGYGYWVVGSKEIRDAEPGFPAPARSSTTRSASAR